MSARLDEVFDVVIVGSGFGGGVLAHALSHAGVRTLLVERGGFAHRDDDDWNGRKILLEGRYRGESPMLVSQHGERAPESLHANEVVGGNSIFFGGAALRFREADFARWPVPYSAFAPHYDAAETLLEVHGLRGADPCEPACSSDYPFPLPQAPSAPAERIARAGRRVGFRPFRLPLAMNLRGGRAPRCERCGTCDGFPCKISAKNDIQTTAIAKADPAFLSIAPRIEAVRLHEANDRITTVEAIVRETGRRIMLRGRVFVLSGGAIASAALLLRSGLDRRDESRSIGRHLMRHCNGIVGALFPFRTNPERIHHKEICVSDLYEARRHVDGAAVGVIQDLCLPPPEVVREKGPPGLKWAAGISARFIQSLICIAEDDARFENRVTVSDTVDARGIPRTAIHHRYTEADQERRALLLAAARRILRAAGGLATQVSSIETFSHAVGTVRFGDSPRAAPLDLNCRFHGVPNLFVVDGAFMPTSAGVNPSLTIAANALRVAEHVRCSLHEL